MATPVIQISWAAGSTPIIPVGGQAMLKIVVLNSNGDPVENDARVSSSDPTIAKVSTAMSRGGAPVSVIGVAPGTVTITVTSAQGAVTNTISATVA